MPDCAYCEETFDDEDAYLVHLRDAHEPELSRIDRRRLRGAMEDDGGSKLAVYGAAAVVLVLLVAAVYVTMGGGGSDTIEAQSLPDNGDETLLEDVQQFPSEGTAHVSQGTEVDYETSPPTSGPHYPTPADPGFYDDQVEAGNLVHSLEHGAVVIYYDPTALTPEAEESLRAFADTHDAPWAAVIVVPNPTAEPDTPYVLTAWRTMLEMDEYDPAVVRAFLAEFIGRGPENPVR